VQIRLPRQPRPSGVVSFAPIGWLEAEFRRRLNPHPGRALTVRDVGALSDFDYVTVGIADIAAYLAVLGYRFRDELGSSTFP